LSVSSSESLALTGVLAIAFFVSFRTFLLKGSNFSLLFFGAKFSACVVQATHR